MRKTHFLRGKLLFAEIHIFARNFAFLVKRCTFPVLGPQKTSQKLVFIKGFKQGTQKGAIGAQKCFFRSRTALLAKKPLISFKWRGALEKGRVLFKMYSILQGIPTFRERKMMISQKFAEFYINSLFSTKTRNILRSLRNFARFWSRAARMRQVL